MFRMFSMEILSPKIRMESFLAGSQTISMCPAYLEAVSSTAIQSRFKMNFLVSRIRGFSLICLDMCTLFGTEQCMPIDTQRTARTLVSHLFPFNPLLMITSQKHIRRLLNRRKHYRKFLSLLLL